MVPSIFPKNERKLVHLRYHSTVGRFFSIVFWKNSGYQQVLSKLTDLYIVLSKVWLFKKSFEKWKRTSKNSTFFRLLNNEITSKINDCRNIVKWGKKTRWKEKPQENFTFTLIFAKLWSLKQILRSRKRCRKKVYLYMN